MTQRQPIRLNGLVLPPQMIAAEAQHHPARSPAIAFRAAARALIIRTLLLEEANRLCITGKPQLVAPGKRELDDEATIRALMEVQVPVIEPGESACRTFYDANPLRFRGPDLFEASHILFLAHKDDAKAYAAALARGKMIIAELRSAPQRFEAIAREQSACDSRNNSGRLGQIGPGETVPEFEWALRRLEVGQISPSPVESRFGVHILRLDARIEGETLPFDYVRPRIADFLAERQWRLAAASYVNSLVAQAQIEGIDMTEKADAA